MSNTIEKLFYYYIKGGLIMSITILMDYLESIISYYAEFLFIISALGLFIFQNTQHLQEEFPKEAMIAKFGSIAYVTIGIGLFIVRLFL